MAAQALRTVSGYQVDEAGIAYVLAGLSELPAHPDVLPAARLLAGAGMRMACLTNGSAAVTGVFVQRAGLGGYVERVISVEEARTWKPPAAVYRHAATVLGVETGRLALVAAHATGTRVLSHLRPARRYRARPHRGRTPPAGPARPTATGKLVATAAGYTGNSQKAGGRTRHPKSIRCRPRPA